MTALVDDAAAPYFADLVDAIRELIAAVLDMDRRRPLRQIAAIHIGDTRHQGTGQPTPEAQRMTLGFSSRVIGLVDSEGFEFAVERRALHADKFGRARNVATEPADLSNEIFALKHLARIAQRQSHEVLAAVAAGHGGDHGAYVLWQH